jgi:hypothetical protein
MTDRITFTAKERTREGSALPVTAGFRTTNVATAPTTAKYRVDDPDSGCEKVGWTNLTPASSIAFTIAASANECGSCRAIERRELIVMADEGLSTQFVERLIYEVENVCALPA